MGAAEIFQSRMSSRVSNQAKPTAKPRQTMTPTMLSHGEATGDFSTRRGRLGKASKTDWAKIVMFGHPHRRLHRTINWGAEVSLPRDGTCPGALDSLVGRVGPR